MSWQCTSLLSSTNSRFGSAGAFNSCELHNGASEILCISVFLLLDICFNLDFQFSSLHFSSSFGTTAIRSDTKRFFSIFTLPFCLLELHFYTMRGMPSVSTSAIKPSSSMLATMDDGNLLSP